MSSHSPAEHQHSALSSYRSRVMRKQKKQLKKELRRAAIAFSYGAMLQRTLQAGFIAPCLPTKTDRLPSGSEWLHEASTLARGS
jgi:hypothetical protein